MHQISRPLPQGARLCAAGHHPQLVESRGTPRGQTLLTTHRPAQFHVECSLCGTATVPAFAAEKALGRWDADRPSLFQIPISELGHVRERVFAAIAA
jgi:hypothetical protein